MCDVKTCEARPYVKASEVQALIMAEESGAIRDNRLFREVMRTEHEYVTLHRADYVATRLDRVDAFHLGELNVVWLQAPPNGGHWKNERRYLCEMCGAKRSRKARLCRSCYRKMEEAEGIRLRTCPQCGGVKSKPATVCRGCRWKNYRD